MSQAQCGDSAVTAHQAEVLSKARSHQSSFGSTRMGALGTRVETRTREEAAESMVEEEVSVEEIPRL